MKRSIEQTTSPSKRQRPQKLRIGVLALQGAFREHCTMLEACNGCGVEICAVEIRLVNDLQNIDGLVIPGGESTAIAKIATRFGTATKGGEFDMFGALREWIKTEQKPVWGTCAGLIFMAKTIVDGAKIGGQPLIGGLDVDVSRNYFGKQIKSFEAEIQPPPGSVSSGSNGESTSSGGDELYTGIFIRAPAIMRTGKAVKTLSTIVSESGEEVVVAVEQGHLLATAFHPELTDDTRWHDYFVRKCL